MNDVLLQRSELEGVSFPDVFSKELYGTYFSPDVAYVVAHNAGFDINVLKAECYRHGLVDLVKALDSRNFRCKLYHSNN